MEVSYAKAMIRAKSDKHSNTYLVIRQNHYLHKVTAQLVCNELNKSLNGLEIHHRLIDETGTVKGNQLQNLTVLTDTDHKRLHKLLHDMRLFEFSSNYFNINLLCLHPSYIQVIIKKQFYLFLELHFVHVHVVSSVITVRLLPHFLHLQSIFSSNFMPSS